MIRRPPRSKPTGTLCPDTTLFRYEHKKTGEAGVYALYAGSENEGTWSEALARTAATMHEKNRAVLDDPSDVALADRFVEERNAGASRCLLDLRPLCSFGHFTLPAPLITFRSLLRVLGAAHTPPTLTRRLPRPAAP